MATGMTHPTMECSGCRKPLMSDGGPWCHMHAQRSTRLCRQLYISVKFRMTVSAWSVWLLTGTLGVVQKEECELYMNLRYTSRYEKLVKQS